MRVSLSWLQKLVKVMEPVDILAEKLSMAGFEVESIEDLSQQCNGVVVGYVTECLPHPNSDKLSVCQVNVGSSQLQIVCGAKNIREGVHVAVATIGSELKAVDLIIKETKLRGIKSQGMICSLNELGIPSSDQGIAILDELTNKVLAKGNEVSKLLDLDDVIIELAITANRPDGLSMLGIAREVAALTGQNLNPYPVSDTDSFEEYLPSIDTIKNLGNSGIYSLSKINDINVLNGSSEWIENCIKKAGIKNVNCVVDICNYVMLEHGQPLHAFDAALLDNIVGKPVEATDFGLRYGKENEMFSALDGSKIKLTTQNLLVTCNDIPIAIAGVIGSLNTAITSNTTSIWLEAAVFNQSSIRKSSRSIGIRTESSSRFEKGVPVDTTLSSSNRAIELLLEHTNCNVIGKWNFLPKERESKIIKLRRDKINSTLGPLSNINDKGKINTMLVKLNTDHYLDEQNFLVDEIILRILISLGCNVSNNEDGWDVQIPSLRAKDLLREIDLIEEIARLVGYDNFEAKIPHAIEPGRLTAKQQVERNIRWKLCATGMQEVLTTSLVRPDLNDLDRISIKNPLLADTSNLRTNLWSEHTQICLRNLTSSAKYCWIYEIGYIYKKNNNKFVQSKVLCGLLCGQNQLERWTNKSNSGALSYYEARGKLEQVMQYLRIEVKDEPLINDQTLHPGRASKLFIENSPVGRFGQLHPSVCSEIGIPDDCYIFEIQMESIINASTRRAKWSPIFKPYPTVPYMERDITVVVSDKCTASQLIQAIKKAGKKLIENVELIDQFKGEGIGKNKYSKTFRIRYRSEKETLTEEILAPIHENVRQYLNKSFELELRS